MEIINSFSSLQITLKEIISTIRNSSKITWFRPDTRNSYFPVPRIIRSFIRTKIIELPPELHHMPVMVDSPPTKWQS